MEQDLESAVRMLLAQIVKENALPFRPSIDPFHSPQNIKHLETVNTDVLTTRNISQQALITE